MKGLFAVIALLSGAALACQVGLNSVLRPRMGHPIPAALVSFAVGLVALVMIGAAVRPELPQPGALARGPWWIWMGGVVGAGYVAAAAAFGSRMGAGAWLGLVITGQVLCTVVLDHYGL